jgi:hypothetical protein
MRYLILAGALLAVAGSANAQSRCNRPYAPAVSVSAESSAADIARVGADVRSFIAASDIYQTCLASRLQTSESQRLLNANQADKQRVANAYNLVLRSRR